MRFLGPKQESIDGYRNRCCSGILTDSDTRRAGVNVNSVNGRTANRGVCLCTGARACGPGAAAAAASAAGADGGTNLHA